MTEPRFHGTVTEKSRHNMSRIRGKDTGIEIALRKALWRQGIRYRKNYKKVPGSPDIAVTRYKIAIFCDSEFFHGKDWDTKRAKIESGSNGGYWVRKIERNIQRDMEKDRALENLEWKVIHFWGGDITRDVAACVQTVQEMICEVRMERADDGSYGPDLSEGDMDI